MFDTEAPVGPPPLELAVFDRLHDALQSGGPAQAIDALIAQLREAGHFDALFYALLMRKRLELGVPPFPSGPATDIPEQHHDAYEDAIRQAGREVGGIYLSRNDLAHAWVYYRMLGEPQPVIDALDAANPAPDADVQPLIDIALYQGVHPKRGFDLIVERYGICNAITTLSSQDFSRQPDVHEHCTKRLVQSLADQLAERLRSDIAAHDKPTPPESATIPELLAGNAELFAEGAYHIDLSHLSAVIQFAMQLPDCPERKLARQLCQYGQQLTTPFQSEGNPPFEKLYHDAEIFFQVLDGEQVDAGIAHFHAKAEAAQVDGEIYPAEVLVNLLVRIGRTEEALATAKQFLAAVPEGQLSCPGVYELAKRVGDWATIESVARERRDAIQFLAAKLAQVRA